MMHTFDLNATISRLFVYPVKSCAGIEVAEAILTDTGLEFDRAWMVVDSSGEFVTQRELPRMALIKPQLKQYEMILRAPGMLALHIALDAVQEPCTATVWGHACAAYDMGNVAGQWFTDFLAQDLPPGQSARPLRMVRFDPEHQRLSNPSWTKDIQALNQFSDGYPLLVVSEASLQGLNDRLLAAGHVGVTIERFRPNIVFAGCEAHDEDRVAQLVVQAHLEPVELVLVKPCPRCPIPHIDPATALSAPHVGNMLQSYRQDPRVQGAVTFGMNAVIRSGAENLLRIGQQVQANWVFD